MAKWILVPALALLALGGCGSPADAPEGENRVVPADAANLAEDNAAQTANAAAAVVALSEGQRNGVLIRAILKAGLTCDRVERSVRLPERGGNPVWRAECNDGNLHSVAVTPDGTALIVSRSD